MSQKEIPWFYHPDLAVSSLLPDEARHAASALRLQVGGSVVLTTGVGQIATAKVSSLKKGDVEVAVQSVAEHLVRPGAKTLVIGRLHHADRMEWLIEKAQELGLQRLIIADMDHCGTGKLSLERARRIAISALKQSHQVWLIDVIRTNSLAEATPLLADNTLYGYLPQDGAEPDTMHAQGHANAVIIGPEADFSASELALMNRLGYKPVSLGQTRLRAETAGLAAAVFLQLWA
jgi:16S rRNA (uracil1498-N3)-methyltransferase